MIRRPPKTTSTATLFPYATLVRSDHAPVVETGGAGAPARRRYPIGLCTVEHVPAARASFWFREQKDARARPMVPRRPGKESAPPVSGRSEEHTSELQSLMRNSYAVFCLQKKKSQRHATQIVH